MVSAWLAKMATIFLRTTLVPLVPLSRVAWPVTTLILVFYALVVSFWTQLHVPAVLQNVLLAIIQIVLLALILSSMIQDLQTASAAKESYQVASIVTTQLSAFLVQVVTFYKADYAKFVAMLSSVAIFVWICPPVWLANKDTIFQEILVFCAAIQWLAVYDALPIKLVFNVIPAIIWVPLVESHCASHVQILQDVTNVTVLHV